MNDFKFYFKEAFSRQLTLSSEFPQEPNYTTRKNRLMSFFVLSVKKTFEIEYYILSTNKRYHPNC